jgi:hypothetical protein
MGLVSTFLTGAPRGTQSFTEDVLLVAKSTPDMDGRWKFQEKDPRSYTQMERQ